MSSQILTTKLIIPQIRPESVVRSRLYSILNYGQYKKLVLVSASAGFGKTTLVSSWIRSESITAAWLSLDEEHSNPLRFVTYFISAVQTVSKKIGTFLINSLQSSPAPPMESLLSILLNDIAACNMDFSMVLDDYHLVDRREIDHILKYIIDHQPPNLHLILITREDPNLPLARLRAGDQLTEIRNADLRFTDMETLEFFQKEESFHLSDHEIKALETRTEGWIAGLHLAALSLRNQKDISGFIKSFTGSHIFITDYLVQEVLDQQPESLLIFLLSTSILKSLSGPLCDAVTANPEIKGQDMLEKLEQSNMFILPLDNDRHWYRYHLLFSDLLRKRLTGRKTTKDIEISELHSRASRWFEENGYESEAVHHALAARDFERAASLVERALPTMDAGFQSPLWLQWIMALPEDLIQNRPVLCAGYAQALMDTGEFDEVESRLLDAEKWLDEEYRENANPKMIVADKDQFHGLHGTIANARAYYALAVNDGEKALLYAQKAQDNSSSDDPLRTGIASALLGLAQWSKGKLKAAYQILEIGIMDMGKAGNTLYVIGGTPALVEIKMAQGKLTQAAHICHQALELSEGLDESVQWVAQNIHIELCLVYCEQNRMDEAISHFEHSLKLAEHSILSDWPYRSALARAKIEAAEGRLEQAILSLEKAEQLFIKNPAPDPAPAGAIKARLWLKKGQLKKTKHWLDERNVNEMGNISYLREYEYITLVRLLIEEYRRDTENKTLKAAAALIDSLQDAAETDERGGSLIEILILKSIICLLDGNRPDATLYMGQALTLSESEDYIRIFTDEVDMISELLIETSNKTCSKEYRDRLIKALCGNKQQEGNFMSYQLRVEPLTERELEVLRLIEQGLSNQEIGARLFLALTTVKGYNQRIFGKLEVKRRTEAVAKARELGLFNSDG